LPLLYYETKEMSTWDLKFDTGLGSSTMVSVSGEAASRGAFVLL